MFERMQLHKTLLISIYLLAHICSATGGRNPCHPRRWRARFGVTCERVVLPTELCTKCKLKPFQANGAFTDCTAIYDIDDGECREQLRQYAQLNGECDPVRARQVLDFQPQQNRFGLDYFLYAVCEQCCDCVPIGASVAQYEQRQMNDSLLNVRRGNCAAHAYFDLRNLWPEVRYVSAEGGDSLPTAPKILPFLDAWINSPAANDWIERSDVQIDPNIEAFLSLFVRAAVCSNRDVWESCTALEVAQNRV